MTPYQEVYGCLPHSIPPYTRGGTKIQALDELLQEREAILHILKQNLVRARSRMKQQANKKRRDMTFKIGDLVMVKLQPHRQTTLVGRWFQKLYQRFYGHFSIIKLVGPVVYRL